VSEDIIDLVPSLFNTSISMTQKGEKSKRKCEQAVNWTKNIIKYPFCLAITGGIVYNKANFEFIEIYMRKLS